MQEASAGLRRLFERGGMVRRLKAATPKEAVTRFIRAITAPLAISRDALITAALEREDLMPTSAGRGVALPHPRSPLITDLQEQFAAVGFLEAPVDWQALDREPVHTMFLIVSASAREHLAILSRLHFFCQQEPFQRLLRERACLEGLIRALEEGERSWNEKT
ncbi:MAG: PTS sugar transporter subunit IIA [Spirochaetaceae bacterium]|jgi:PTS system nitrogen regulatory IIA component|nr:PTS sugar transporter subunit IIA [Spirochaetaceae bacterium]